MKLDSRQLKNLILEEMSMIGMAPMHSIGHVKSLDHGDSSMHMMAKGGVSREDCCKAIMCLVECCSCPITKQAIIECCQDLMSGHYDRR